MDHLLCPTCGMHCFNDEDLETHECFIYCYQVLTSTSFRIMYIMLNNISKTVAYTTQLLPQLSIMNLQNYIHDAEYVNEHNIRYAEIL